MAQEQFPDISQALLDRLDLAFPYPEIGQTPDVIYARLGQRDLIKFLQLHFDRQNGITKE